MFVSLVPGPGTEQGLSRCLRRKEAREGSRERGREQMGRDNDPRISKLFFSFRLSGNALRGSWKAASTSLSVLGLSYSYLRSGSWKRENVGLVQ